MGLPQFWGCLNFRVASILGLLHFSPDFQNYSFQLQVAWGEIGVRSVKWTHTDNFCCVEVLPSEIWDIVAKKIVDCFTLVTSSIECFYPGDIFKCFSLVTSSNVFAHLSLP